jgi:hypothetical protein
LISFLNFFSTLFDILYISSLVNPGRKNKISSSLAAIFDNPAFSSSVGFKILTITEEKIVETS